MEPSPPIQPTTNASTDNGCGNTFLDLTLTCGPPPPIGDQRATSQAMDTSTDESDGGFQSCNA